MSAQVTLKEVMENLRKGPEGLVGELDAEGKSLDSKDPYGAGKTSPSSTTSASPTRASRPPASA